MAEGTRNIDDVLRSTSLLSATAPSTIDALSRASRARTLERDEVLFTTGDPPSSVCVVATGMLRVFSTSLHGSEPTLAIVHPNETVGELGVLDEVERSASVAGLRRSTVVVVPAAAFGAAYDSDPAIARHMVTMLAARLRTVTDGLADLAYLDLGARLAKYLINETVRQQQSTLTLPLTQAELGQLLGGARQTVNQVARALERAGLVELTGRHVRIVDVEGLRLRAMSAGDAGD